MKLRALLPLLSLPLLAASAGDALAQAEPRSDLRPGAFVLMGPDGADSSATAALTILSGEGADEPILRLDLTGQYIAPSGMGGYVSVAGSSYDGDSHLGSLEVGALYNRIASTSDLTFRAGLVLPTSSFDDDSSFEDIGGALAHLSSTALARPSDLMASVPETTTLRLSVSPNVRRNNFVLRADAGLDVIVAQEGEDEDDAPYLHLDFGAGFDDGKMAFLFEMSTLMYLEDNDNILQTLGVTGQVHTGTATPYATLILPVGDIVDEVGDVYGLTLGVRGRL